MTSFYWICLFGGLAFSALAVFLGDVLDGALDSLDGAFDSIDLGNVLDPLSFVGGLTVFGGAGILLENYTGLAALPGALVAALVGLVLAVIMHFAYVKPMKRSENSTAFSVREYVGRIGEVNTAIPANGYGEVLVRMGVSVTFQAAASFNDKPIPTGTQVVVVEVAGDGSLSVTPLEDEVEQMILPSGERPRLGKRAGA